MLTIFFQNTFNKYIFIQVAYFEIAVKHIMDMLGNWVHLDWQSVGDT